MKRLYPSIFLAAIVISAIAATVKISDLTLSTSPSTNTFLEIADMNDTPKSKKYLLTNLVTVAQGQASTNALTNTFVLKAGDSMSGALTGPSSTWTNGVTAGASTFTGPVTMSGIPAINFAVMWGDSVTLGLVPDLSKYVPWMPFYNGGVNGQNSTEIATRMLAATDLQTNGFTMIWAGLNSVPATDSTTIKSDIASMVAVVNTNRYLVMGILQNTNWYRGTSNYIALTNLNAELATIYGSSFVELRTPLVAAYNPLSTPDLVAWTNDVPSPTVLGTSAVHPNEYGRLVLISNVLASVSSKWTTNIALAFGDRSSQRNQRGFSAQQVGENISFGQDSGRLVTNSTAGNVLIGYNSGASLVGGQNNTAVGHKSLSTSTSGNANTSVGYGSLLSSTVGSNNTAVGFYALNASTTGANNTAIGNTALSQITNGVLNTAVGHSSMRANTSGSNNVSVGAQALDASTTASYNVALGSGALLLTTSGGQNVAIGANAMNNNLSAINNVAVGYLAAYSGTGANNTAVGALALNSSTTTENTAVGTAAMRFTTTGRRNSVLGYSALLNSTNGTENVVAGYSAMTAAKSASQSTAIGHQALNGVTSGSYNIGIGYNVAPGLTTGTNNIIIGNGTETWAPTGNNQTVVGNSNTVNSLIFGYHNLPNITITPTGAQIGTNGAAIWSSNAVVYVSVSADGSSVTTKQIAP